MADKNLFIKVTGEQLQQIFNEIKADVALATPDIFSEYVVSPEYETLTNNLLEQKLSSTNESIELALSQIESKVEQLVQEYTANLDDMIIQLVNDKLNEMFPPDTEPEEPESQVQDNE